MPYKTVGCVESSVTSRETSSIIPSNSHSLQYCAPSSLHISNDAPTLAPGRIRRNYVRRVSSIDTEVPYHYSEVCVPVKSGAYEFWDSPNSLIGHGSYGIVFRGVDHTRGGSSGTVVAVKKMARINVKPEELALMKRVRDANLVNLIDVCDEENDLTYLVMELCDNDLDRHLRRSAIGGRLGIRELKTVVESIAKGYYALHIQHIVHRDIKPQNILLLYSPFDGSISAAKITDFGVSRVLTEQDESGLCTVAGTVLYMAPEVGANLLITSQYDSAADMWSIGCVLYQCWVGKLPFDESTLCRLFLYCAGGNFDAYEAPPLPENTDRGLRFLIDSLLEIDAHKRATPTQLHAAVLSHLLMADKNRHSAGGALETEVHHHSSHSLDGILKDGAHLGIRHLLSVRDGHGKSL